MVLVLVLTWSPSSHHHRPWSCPVLGWLRWPAACVPVSSLCQPRCLHPHPCVVSLSQFSRSWSWSWHHPGPRSWSLCLSPSCHCHCCSHPGACGPWSWSLPLSPLCCCCGPRPCGCALARPSPCVSWSWLSSVLRWLLWVIVLFPCVCVVLILACRVVVACPEGGGGSRQKNQHIT
jgi:hypothetical protein